MAALLAVVAMGVAACGRGPVASQPTAGSSTSTAGRSVPVKTTSSPATADGSSSRSPGPAYLRQMEQETAAAAQTTFKVTYSASDNTTVVYAQMDGKSSFVAGSTGYYDNGTSNTVCDNGNATPVCYTNAQPLQGVLSLVEPARALGALQAVAARTASITHTSQPHDVQCVSYSLQGELVKYCINRQGIVTYVGVPSGDFKLSQYTTAVSDAEVSVPANALTNPS